MWHRCATVTRAVYPSRYPLALPPPGKAAPPELAEMGWPWQLGSGPGDIEDASKFWCAMVEDYLDRLHQLGRPPLHKGARDHGLQVETAPLVPSGRPR